MYVDIATTTEPGVLVMRRADQRFCETQLSTEQKQKQTWPERWFTSGFKVP